ncbi:MAG: hypothetical protein M3P30_08245 [Chloroflexota bacterium]|nr:hypothetical protein [Chloroflexota bacterium]
MATRNDVGIVWASFRTTLRGDEVIVKLQRFDGPAEFFDASGNVVKILGPRYLIEFTPPLRIDELHYIVQMECSPGVLEPA